MITDKIKRQFNLAHIKLKDAVLYTKEKTCHISFLVKDIPSAEVAEQIQAFCTKEAGVKTITLFKKAIADADVAISLAKTALKEKWQTIYNLTAGEDFNCLVQNGRILLTIALDEELKNFAVKNSIDSALRDILTQYFFEDVQVTLIKKQESFNEEILMKQQQKIIAQSFKPTRVFQYFTVQGAESYIGEKITGKAVQISGIKHPCDLINVVGKIKFFKKQSFIKKGKVAQEKFYYRFFVYDGTGEIQVTVFETTQNKAKLEKLCDHTTVLIQGRIEIYNDRLSLRPKMINLCEGFKADDEKPLYKEAEAEYVRVFPQKYTRVQQMMLEEKEKKIPVYLQNKDFVVFDTETTGLTSMDSEIIEIAGVKIQNGKITETFTSLIKPTQYTISSNTTTITGITPAMVQNSPVFAEIIADFFKWTRGATLVAYNAEFDMAFLRAQSKPFMYFFDNEVMDALAMARNHLRGLKNYKLKTVCESLKISLTEAHRALNDALATAEVFMHLCTFLT